MLDPESSEARAQRLAASRAEAVRKRHKRGWTWRQRLRMERQVAARGA